MALSLRVMSRPLIFAAAGRCRHRAARAGRMQSRSWSYSIEAVLWHCSRCQASHQVGRCLVLSHPRACCFSCESRGVERSQIFRRRCAGHKKTRSEWEGGGRELAARNRGCLLMRRMTIVVWRGGLIAAVHRLQCPMHRWRCGSMAGWRCGPGRGQVGAPRAVLSIGRPHTVRVVRGAWPPDRGNGACRGALRRKAAREGSCTRNRGNAAKDLNLTKNDS